MLNSLQHMRLKLLQKEQLKKSEATGNLIGNTIANKITKVSKKFTIK